MAIRDLYDLTHQVASTKKVDPYPRPWPAQNKQRSKPHADLTQAEIVAALRFAGHEMPIPVSA